MIVKDSIYGEFKIDDLVLVELIKSPSLQRLKKIKQHGLPKSNFHEMTRYEHSVGVMLLLRILGANLEEQIAGLLHDVSHTAFSHLIDWVFGDIEKESFQDKQHKRFINSTNIPEILKKFRYEVKRVRNIKSFSLLEQKSPNICADRVDYALREFYYWLNPHIVKYCLNNLTVLKEKMVFRNMLAAKIFATNFLKLQSDHWGKPDTILRYYLFSTLLKDALQEKIITNDDLYKYDSFVLKKLEKSKNSKITSLLSLMDKKLDYKINPKLPEMNLKKKFRYVDPLFIQNGKLTRLSKVDLKFKRRVESEKHINRKGLKLNLISQASI